MLLDDGYNLPASTQDRLRLLDWIADNGGTAAGVTVDLGPLFEDLDYDGGLPVFGNLEALEVDGLLHLRRAANWAASSCTVTPAGVDLIEDLRHRRSSLMGRNMAARDAFLCWLYDCTLHGDPSPTRSDFANSKYGSYYGHTFTEVEIIAATEFLAEEDYIKGDGAWGAGIPRPTITAKGRRMVESGRSVNDDAPAAANTPTPVTTNMTITGSHNTIAANSPGAVQNVSVTMTEDNRRQVAAVADHLEGLLRLDGLGLDEQQTAQAEEAVAELREVAEKPAAEKGVVRRALENAGDVAVSGTGSALGQGVVALVTQALQGLG